MKLASLDTKKLKRNAIRKFVGKFLKMKSGREVLLIEEEYPVLRVFNGKCLANICVRDVDELLDIDVFKRVR